MTSVGARSRLRSQPRRANGLAAASRLASFSDGVRKVFEAAALHELVGSPLDSCCQVRVREAPSRNHYGCDLAREPRRWSARRVVSEHVSAERLQPSPADLAQRRLPAFDRRVWPVVVVEDMLLTVPE